MFLREFTSKPVLEDDPEGFTSDDIARKVAKNREAEKAEWDEITRKVAKGREAEKAEWDDINRRVAKGRETAIAAGFVKPDGSADTRAYFASIAKKQDAVAKAADEKYWRDNPNGKWEKIGNVTSMVMPPEQHHPDAIKAQGLKIDAAQAARTKAYKDKVKASGGKFMGQTGPEPIQATPTADDPKPWILTKPMPRPWRKDQKPLPMGQVAVDYNKQYPNAAKSRAAQIAAKKMARAEAEAGNNQPTTEGDMKADREAGIKWVDNPNWKRLHDMDDEMIHAYLDHKKSVKKEVRTYEYRRGST